MSIRLQTYSYFGGICGLEDSPEIFLIASISLSIPRLKFFSEVVFRSARSTFATRAQSVKWVFASRIVRAKWGSGDGIDPGAMGSAKRISKTKSASDGEGTSSKRPQLLHLQAE